MNKLLETEVLVVGGGVSGFNAALAAAQAGASVTIIEKFPFLGGTATGGMVAAFNGFYWYDQKVTTGTADIILRELERIGGGSGFREYTAGKLTPDPFTFKVYPFDPELLKVALDKLATRFQIKVLHNSSAFQYNQLDDGCCIVNVLGPTGVFAIEANQVVDATADAVIAEAAGARLFIPPIAQRQPMTQMMRVSGINWQDYEAVPDAHKKELVRAGIADGRFFYQTIAHSSSPSNADSFLLITSVENFDGRDPEELSSAEVEGRRQAIVSLDYLRHVMPGFQDASLVQLAPRIGQRESVRVRGLELLDGKSVISGADHPEVISYGGGPVDRHVGDSVRLAPPELPFAVPRGVLIPWGTSRMTVAGRTISTEPGAMDGLRHMGGMMPVGQAAGVISALAAVYDMEPSDVDYAVIRKTLLEQGATVDRIV